MGPVAVKLLKPDYAEAPDIVRRFLQEAQAAAVLDHSHVVDVLDMGQESSGTVYLVLERLVGETLKEHLKRGPLSPSDAVQVLEPVLR